MFSYIQAFNLCVSFKFCVSPLVKRLCCCSTARWGGVHCSLLWLQILRLLFIQLTSLRETDFTCSLPGCFILQKSQVKSENNIQIVYTLLEKGADLYIQNNTGETPVDLIVDPTMKTMIEKYVNVHFSLYQNSHSVLARM